MGASVETTTQKRRLSRFFSWCVQKWTSIITIGITDQLSDWEKKRTRLLNGICAMAIIALTVYCLMYLEPVYWLTFWESFQGLVAYLIVILLNYRRRYMAACHFFNLYNMASYTFQAISHGVVDGVEYILVIGAIASMLFFRPTWIVVLYFLLNALCFALCKYSFTVMKPFLFMANGEDLYTSNHVLLFVILFLIVFYLKSENARQEGLLKTKNLILAEEKQKSDKLLLNILPMETAEELKRTGSAKAKSFDLVTVMFTDCKNFTHLAEQLPPEKLVHLINYYFSAFDWIIAQFNIEKIKTIGDAYMCAGGLPEPNNTHAEDIVRAALEIQRFVEQQKEIRTLANLPFFELRIGIHTGPVVAGIVGTQKFAYDIWGDTVNTAARMESGCEEGKINISGATHAMVKSKFKCLYRGKMEAKNKGTIDSYYVEGPMES